MNLYFLHSFLTVLLNWQSIGGFPINRVSGWGDRTLTNSNILNENTERKDLNSIWIDFSLLFWLHSDVTIDFSFLSNLSECNSISPVHTVLEESWGVTYISGNEVRCKS